MCSGLGQAFSPWCRKRLVLGCCICWSDATSLSSRPCGHHLWDSQQRTLQALRGTKLLLQNYLQSLVMCSMPQVNPHMHVSSIALIWLMRPNSLPSFDAIAYPSLSWMNSRNKLIACLPRDGSNHPLHLMAILFFLHAKRMAACAFVLISTHSMLTHVWINTPSHILMSC